VVIYWLTENDRTYPPLAIIYIGNSLLTATSGLDWIVLKGASE